MKEKLRLKQQNQRLVELQKINKEADKMIRQCLIDLTVFCKVEH